MAMPPSRSHSRSVSSVKASDDDFRHHGGYGSEEAMQLAAAHRSVSAAGGAREGAAAAHAADSAIEADHHAPSQGNAVMRESDKVLDFLFTHYARPAHSLNGSLSYALLLQLGRDTAMLDRLPHREAAGLMASVKPRPGQERIRAGDFRLIVHLVATTSAVSQSPDEAYHHLCARMLKNFVGKFPHKLPPNLMIPRDTDARPTTVTHTGGIIAAASAVASSEQRPTTPRRSGGSVSTVRTAASRKPAGGPGAPADSTPLEAASFVTTRRGSAATNLSSRSTTASTRSRAIPSTQPAHQSGGASSRLGGPRTGAASSASSTASTWRRPAAANEQRRQPARAAAATGPAPGTKPAGPSSVRAEGTARPSTKTTNEPTAPRHDSRDDDDDTDTDDPVVASVLAQHEADRVTRDAEPLSERIVGDLDAIGYRPRGLGAAADQCRAYLETGAEPVTLCNMLGIPPTLAPLFDADSITTDGEFWGSIRRCARIVFPEAGCQVVAEELAFQRIFEGAMVLEGCGDETSYMSA